MSPRPALRPPAAVLAALFLGPAAASAQLAVLRSTAAAPLDADSGRRFPMPAFVGAIARGSGSAEDAQAWNVTLGGVAQLRTRSGRTALVLQVGHEMTANPYNSGGLNPRGTAWEEDVYLLRRVGEHLELRGGVFFRCRHEIDSATPVDERPGAPPSRVGTRIVMNKGVEVGVATRELRVAPKLRLRASATGDRFTAREDWRLPESSAGPHWARAQGRVTATARLAYAASRTALPYVRGWASTTFFGAAGPGADTAAVRGTGARLEAGVRLGDGGGAADLFVTGERWFDDLTHPVPRASRVVAVGLRLGSATFY